jgi:hypothetical protein
LSEKIAKLLVSSAAVQMDGHNINRLTTLCGRMVLGSDELSVFESGEHVVVIAEAEYEAMKSLNDAIKTVGATGEALITTKSKYYAMERFIAEQGFVVDGWGNVTMKGVS